MTNKTNWPAAIAFYAIFIGGLVFFAINPALEKGSWIDALKIGTLFGFLSYSTYDLINLASLKDRTLKITLIDIL